jgi:outer membrane receptor protein involved in Fe transport
MNDSLMPENMWMNLTAGIEHKINKNIPVELQIFRKDYTDYITFDSVNFAGMPVNIPGVSVTGFMAKSDFKLGSSLSQNASYTYSYGLSKNSGIYPAYIPEHKLILRTDYEISPFLFSFNAEYLSGMYYSISSAEKTSPYLLIGLKGEYKLSDALGIFVSADNILNQDREYIKGYIYPGAMFGAGVNLRF